LTAYRSVNWTFGHVPTQASAHSTKASTSLSPKHTSPCAESKSTAAPKFKSVFDVECQARGLELFVLPPNAPISTEASNAPNQAGDTSSTPQTIGRIAKLQTLVEAFAQRFNRHKPHQGLGDRRPAEYLQAISPVGRASKMI
jgi:hypothetical protein